MASRAPRPLDLVASRRWWVVVSGGLRSPDLETRRNAAERAADVASQKVDLLLRVQILATMCRVLASECSEGAVSALELAVSRVVKLLQEQPPLQCALRECGERFSDVCYASLTNAALPARSAALRSASRLPHIGLFPSTSLTAVKTHCLRLIDDGEEVEGAAASALLASLLQFGWSFVPSASLCNLAVEMTTRACMNSSALLVPADPRGMDLSSHIYISYGSSLDEWSSGTVDMALIDSVIKTSTTCAINVPGLGSLVARLTRLADSEMQSARLAAVKQLNRLVRALPPDFAGCTPLWDWLAAEGTSILCTGKPRFRRAVASLAATSLSVTHTRLIVKDSSEKSFIEMDRAAWLGTCNALFSAVDHTELPSCQLHPPAFDIDVDAVLENTSPVPGHCVVFARLGLEVCRVQGRHQTLKTLLLWFRRCFETACSRGKAESLSMWLQRVLPTRMARVLQKDGTASDIVVEFIESCAGSDALVEQLCVALLRSLCRACPAKLQRTRVWCMWPVSLTPWTVLLWKDLLGAWLDASWCEDVSSRFVSFARKHCERLRIPADFSVETCRDWLRCLYQCAVLCCSHGMCEEALGILTGVEAMLPRVQMASALPWVQRVRSLLYDMTSATDAVGRDQECFVLARSGQIRGSRAETYEELRSALPCDIRSGSAFSCHAGRVRLLDQGPEPPRKRSRRSSSSQRNLVQDGRMLAETVRHCCGASPVAASRLERLLESQTGPKTVSALLHSKPLKLLPSALFGNQRFLRLALNVNCIKLGPGTFLVEAECVLSDKKATRTSLRRSMLQRRWFQSSFVVFDQGEQVLDQWTSRRQQPSSGRVKAHLRCDSSRIIFDPKGERVPAVVEVSFCGLSGGPFVSSRAKVTSL